MSIGFGFSVGDFIAALELIGKVSDALRDSGHATANFKALVEDVEQLKFVLLRVQQVKLDPRLRDQELAIEVAANTGLIAVEGFWNKIAKYEKHLYAANKRLTVRDILARIEWAFKKEDVEEFRTRIQGFTSIFTTLLTAVDIQMSRLNGEDRRQEHAKTMSALSDHTSWIMASLRTLASGVDVCIRQGTILMNAGNQALAMTVTMFTMVQQMHQVIMSLGLQTSWGRPIEFWDAFGRRRTVHLDLVRSREHLMNILMVDLEQAGCNEYDKALVRGGSFVFTDLKPESASESYWQLIDLDRPWDQCFHPGQIVGMTVLFPAIFEDSSADLDSLSNTHQRPSSTSLQQHTPIRPGSNMLISEWYKRSGVNGSYNMQHIKALINGSKFVRLECLVLYRDDSEPNSGFPARWPRFSLRDGPTLRRMESACKENARIAASTWVIPVR